MKRLMLIVRMADETVALPADAVESVVEIAAMTAVPLAPPHIVGIAPLRSRVVTMVDPRVLLGLDGGSATPFVTIIVAVAGHAYGIIVDEVLDVREAVTEPVLLQGRAAGRWPALAQRSVIVGDRQYLLIDPATLVDGGAAPQSAEPTLAC